MDFGSISDVPVGTIVSTTCPTCGVELEGTRDFDGIGAVRLVIRMPWMPISLDQPLEVHMGGERGLSGSMSLRLQRPKRRFFFRKHRHD